jgi:hypothetical protein
MPRVISLGLLGNLVMREINRMVRTGAIVAAADFHVAAL